MSQSTLSVISAPRRQWVYREGGRGRTMLVSVSAIDRRGSVAVWGLGLGCGREGRRRKAEDGKSTSVSCWPALAGGRSGSGETGVHELLRNADGTLTPTPLAGLADSGKCSDGKCPLRTLYSVFSRKLQAATKPQTREAIKLETVWILETHHRTPLPPRRRTRREVMELTAPGLIRLVVTKTCSASLGQAGLLCAPQAGAGSAREVQHCGQGSRGP